MKQFIGKSDSGNLKEALRGVGDPQLIIMISNGAQFEKHVSELQELYPNVPSIGTTGHFYSNKLKEGGVGIVAMSRVKAAAGVMDRASSAPISGIANLEKNLRDVGASARDTAVIDFSTGNDAMVLTSMYSVLEKKEIQLMGGTAFDGMVSCNGVVYKDAAAYLVVKNLDGKVKTYKENIYQPLDDQRYIVSKADRARYYMGELNGKSAKQVYMDLFHIPEKDISTQTFQNPFGKVAGDDICIVSLKEPSGSGICCYRQVNDSDVLTMLQVGDVPSIVQDTISQIKRDFTKISGAFSVNCAFRYLYFSDLHYFDDYLKEMSQINGFCGFVGNGEHYNSRFVNQTMTCVVFE
ncbi:MAG: hypothetical protein K6G07_07710 [Lachnospiraceae bacterium]|nr:hypothetical protein [Lachnospiraceae bacterium]